MKKDLVLNIFAITIIIIISAVSVVSVFGDDEGLTVITFSRGVNVPYEEKTIQQKVEFTLSGQMVDISSEWNDEYDRTFELKDGVLSWDLYERVFEPDDWCTAETVLVSKGESKVVDLHLDHRDIIFDYEYNSLTDKWELQLNEDLRIIGDSAYTVTPSNPKAMCNGMKVPYTDHEDYESDISMYLKFLDFDNTIPAQKGNMVVKEAVNYKPNVILSGTQGVEFNPASVMIGYVDYYARIYDDLEESIAEDGMWDVSWSITPPGSNIAVVKTMNQPEDESAKDSDNDGLTDAQEREYNTDPNNSDTDGDGLLDGWEVFGAKRADTVIIDFPAMGADPLVKDIYLEIDWMENATRSYKPENEVLQRVINAFADKGIQLHIDIGQWGGGNAITLQDGSEWYGLDLLEQEQLDYEADNKYLFDIKKDNFDKDRIGLFYYSIFVHEKRGTSGQAKPGGNFYVALRHNASITTKSGTLMHEFGHTLQLGHGGRYSDRLEYDNTHFKPNYRSIMNYHFQLGGIPVRTETDDIIYVLDYSNEELPNLDETFGMDERAGITSPLNTGYMSYYTCYDNGHGRVADDVIDHLDDNLFIIFQMNGSTIDWNCDGVIDDPTPVNINGNGNDEFDTLNGTLNLLYGRSDWDKIVLKIGCPDYGIADDFSFQDKFSVTSELDNCPEHDDIRAQFGKDVDDRYPPEVPFMGEACDNEDNDEDGLVDEGCPDTDNDGIVDDLDNCIYISNPDQLDYNHDFIGDACLNNLPMHNIQQELVADSKEPNPEEDTSYDHVNFKDWVIIAIFFVVIIFLVIIWKIMKRKH